MRTHFASIRCTADLFVDAKGESTVNGFVEVSDRKVVRGISKAVKDSGFKVQGHHEVTIKPALTEVDRNRNWALREAEKLIRSSPKLGNGSMKVERADKRGIYVDGLPAFTQKERFARGGAFHGVISDLKLP